MVIGLLLQNGYYKPITANHPPSDCIAARTQAGQNTITPEQDYRMLFQRK
jgi:hypothetical protein